MKKFILFSLSVMMLLTSACQKTSISNKNQGGEGYLSLGGMSIDIDDAVDTKAVAVSNSYMVTIVDADGKTHLEAYYREIKENDYRVTLPAGEYTLSASSTDEAISEVGWECPVYGATKDFTIAAGEVTEIGEVICTLTQCKVTVDYSSEFLACVTGNGKTMVSLIPGFSLDYELGADKRYTRDAGYFMVDGNSLTVTFQGSIDGKNKKMTKVFTGIAPRQWRQIKFIQKVNEQGNATFDIVINPLVSDATLNNAVVSPGEAILGEDPDVPKGDGGITIYPDYAGGCDPEITDLSNMLIVPESERKMAIILKAECPNGIKKFDVAISTDNSSFAAAVAAADATNLNLISPSAQNEVIFQVVPFPHGEEALVGQTVVPFDLSNAQNAILNYKGHHKFTMTIVDQQGCRKSIEVIMVVE